MNKIWYGEVQTDRTLVSEMFDLMPREKFEDPSLRWLDPACGRGVFMSVLSKRLFVSLASHFPDEVVRRKHINENMLYMVEINGEHIPHLESLFPGATITHGDFLSYPREMIFDIIIGNPPFNSQGLKKVPTNKIADKKKDGWTIWPDFVRHAISLLREGGLLSLITPSIWMKPDKAKIYSLLTQYKLDKIRCFTNTETNRLFHGNAQTPTCLFLLQKIPSIYTISLYERNLNRYIPYLFIDTQPIPVFGASLFAKLQPYVLKVGHPHLIKTNMPPKGAILSTERTTDCSYINVRTCILKKGTPTLIYEYSQKPLAFYGSPKLILAHKMYGFPYYDKTGNLGISRRDNYVMVGQSETNCKRWKDFLSTKFALYLFEGTRYRMKYLEKYVFQLIPDITKLDDFPSIINDNTIADYFQCTPLERKAILGLHPQQKRN